jgi:hypothetical protein
MRERERERERERDIMLRLCFCLILCNFRNSEIWVEPNMNSPTNKTLMDLGIHQYSFKEFICHCFRGSATLVPLVEKIFERKNIR